MTDSTTQAHTNTFLLMAKSVGEYDFGLALHGVFTSLPHAVKHAEQLPHLPHMWDVSIHEVPLNAPLHPTFNNGHSAAINLYDRTGALIQKPASVHHVEHKEVLDFGL